MRKYETYISFFIKILLFTIKCYILRIVKNDMKKIASIPYINRNFEISFLCYFSFLIQFIVFKIINF